jgi:hypothetical protein
LTRIRRVLAAIAAASAAAIVVPGLITAHSGEYGLFVDPLSSWPGGAVTVRGDLSSTGPIDLVLAESGGPELLVLTIEDAPNGHFEHTVTIPPSATPGDWSLEARAAGMPTVAVRLPLAAPPPPDDGGAIASPAPPAVADRSPMPRVEAPAAEATGTGLDPVPVLALGSAAAALALLYRRTRAASATR